MKWMDEFRKLKLWSKTDQSEQRGSYVHLMELEMNTLSNGDIKWFSARVGHNHMWILNWCWAAMCYCFAGVMGRRFQAPGLQEEFLSHALLVTTTCKLSRYSINFHWTSEWINKHFGCHWWQKQAWTRAVVVKSRETGKDKNIANFSKS